MIDDDAPVVKLKCNTAITHAASVLRVNNPYMLFNLGIFVGNFLLPLEMIVIRCAGEPRDIEEYIEFMLLPQFRNYLCPFSRCTLSDTKAFNFFK